MKHRPRVRVAALFAGAFLLLEPLAASSQTSPAPKTVPGDNDAVMAEIESKIGAFYVFPEKRAVLIAALKLARQQGKLNAATATGFADAVTDAMQAAIGDKHLRLVHDPDWAKNFAAQGASGSSEEFDREAIRDNFGIAKLERFTGNIRYVRITGFGWVNDRTGAAYDDVMRFLKDGSAVIIDIRGNGGGDHSAVRYLVSHFLKPDTKLYDFASTREPGWQSYALSNLPAGRLIGKPLYLLIDGRTISAGEDLAYQVQQYKLGELVGTRTAGGANNNEYFAIAGRFRLSLSVGRPVHPVSGTNWEGVGVSPTIAVPAHEALDRAIIAAATRLARAPGVTEIERAEYGWAEGSALADLAAVSYSTRDLEKFVGHYDPYEVSLRGGHLWFTRAGGDPMELVPMPERGLFAIAGRDAVRFRFVPGALETLALGAPEPRRFPASGGRGRHQ